MKHTDDFKDGGRNLQSIASWGSAEADARRQESQSNQLGIFLPAAMCEFIIKIVSGCGLALQKQPVGVNVNSGLGVKLCIK